MTKLQSLEEVKMYLDRLALKSADKFESKDYIPLDEYFMSICKKNSFIDIDLMNFTFNDYMDGKITFEHMVDEIMKN